MQFTYQLGQSVGLFYLSQILVTHSKECNRPNCFCAQSFQFTQEQTWISPDQVLKQHLNQVLGEILRLYNISYLENSQEYFLLLSRIETQYQNDKLFETLLRSQKLSSTKFYGYTVLPHHFRIQSHREMFFEKLLQKIEGVRINSQIYFNYCNLVEQLGSSIIKLLNQRQQIFVFLTLQYQNPLYYLYHNKMYTYIKLVQKCEILLNDILRLNPHSIVTKNLSHALYALATFQQDKLKQITSLLVLQNFKIDNLWNTLNDMQCCYVQCKYDNGLIMLNHSILFPKLMEETEIKSDLVGHYIDRILPSPVREVHQTFLRRLIEEGKPRLLNNGIQQFYITTNKGFMKEIDSLVRLGQSMEYLTFMTIMGYKQEDNCGKILLSQKGTVYSYSEQAVNLLQLNRILKLDHKINLNFKICIPISGNINELCNGFIIIPKVNLMQSDSTFKKIQSNNINQVSFYKYFLKHPKQCSVFISIYKFCNSAYDDNKLQYETLYIFQSNEIKDVELKMIALELMFKQVMILHNIQSDTYLTSYTSFKSIIPETYQITNSGKTPSYKEEMNDNNFAISDESIHIQQDPLSLSLHQFFKQEQNEQNEQKVIVNQNNHSSIIANSFQTQDLLISQLRINDELSNRDSRREHLQLIQTNQHSVDIQPHQQLSVREEDDVESPVEMKVEQELEVSIKDLTDQQMKEQIEWIKSQVRVNKYQFHNKQQHFVPTALKKRSNHKLTIEQQPSTSVKSTDSQKGLINHIINGMIQSNPHEFYSILVVALIYAIILVILVTLSIVAINNELHHIYLDSTGGQFSITLLQNINLMEISIHILAHDQKFLAPYFYITNSTDDYINQIRNYNDRKFINPEVLIGLEESQICILHFFSNNGDQVKSCYYTRDFLVDQLPLLFHRITEVVEFYSSRFNLSNMEESYFTLNYPTYFQLATNLIDEAYNEMSNTKNSSLYIASIYVISGVTSCLGVAFFILIAEIQIAKWRVSIVRTYFLFQNLNQALNDQDNEIQRILEIDELSHMKYSLLKLDKNGQQSLKQEYRNIDHRLKKQFWAKQLALVFLIGALELLYFIPYYELFQTQVQQIIDFHNDVHYLGLAQLAFSNRLVHFIQSYANPNYSVDESTFQYYDELYSYYEDIYLFQLPFDNEHDTYSLTSMVNNDICQMGSIVPMIQLGYKCPYILQQGYSKYMVNSQSTLRIMKSDYDSRLGLGQILLDQDFLDIIIAYGFVFPQFNLNRDNLFISQNVQNEDSKVQAILMATLILIALLMVFLTIIYFISKQFLAIIEAVKQSLLIFSRQQIARNKHLVQVLSKEVTLD
ncbi:unnamed protein product (macronuclear) [Paramecium tetraurelia]|uniref:PAS domain-containing protein n=1 Tax=Paramecium tetraurelia TaxID=5888 RepID=A0DUZ1_PARTE|nr:uncharacterized protein GSPATT00020520001 [Paramecium tetraurelia]CAK86858.1 unnamed protein product [Paramecium tetraurelia]|eukprot:XP_001454255.1 hypothetical protein (macronuclear) [Paramecium tetraurelia strain d4-2]